MSNGYELDGRTAQKQRTRSALIAAARGLLERGVVPTVDEAAAAASVSRATAFRYFPTQRALLLAAQPELVPPSLLPAAAPEGPRERLDAVVRELTRLTVQTEPQLRAVLRLSLEPGDADRDELAFRRGRAIRWIEDALAPLSKTLKPVVLRQLAAAIRSAVGIESLVWLTDVAGLERDEAVELQRWSARALLERALAGDPPPVSKTSARAKAPAPSSEEDASVRTRKRKQPRRA